MFSWELLLTSLRLVLVSRYDFLFIVVYFF